jgi:hypothetical protein
VINGTPKTRGKEERKSFPERRAWKRGLVEPFFI